MKTKVYVVDFETPHWLRRFMAHVVRLIGGTLRRRWLLLLFPILSACDFYSALGCVTGSVIGGALNGIVDTIRGPYWRPKDGAVAGSADAGLRSVDAYQNLDGGWVEVTYYDQVNPGHLPQAAMGIDCLKDEGFYHDVSSDGGGIYSLRANATVFSGGITTGAKFDVAFDQMTYSLPNDAGFLPLPDIRMTYTLQ